MKKRRKIIAGHHIGNTGELGCTICGTLINITRFKNGYICSGCLQHVKSHC